MEKVKIAIYSRKSKYSDKGDSVGNQVEIAMKYITQHYPSSEYDVESIIYEDDGFSGGNIDRPKFKEFLTEENKKPFDILICYRLDRISRNIAHFSNLMNYITNLGTNFVSIKEQFDTKTPMGRAMMYIASVFAQLEREVIAERIRDNMIELAKTGRWLGGKTPTGYKSERIELVDVYEQSEDSVLEKKKKKATKLISIDEELELIQEIGYKFLELKSLTKLEAYFVKNKIATKNNLDFSVSTLRRILVNPVYAPNDKDVLEYFNKNGVTIYADGDRANFDGKYGLIGYGKKDGKKDRNIKDWIVSVGFHQPAFKEGIVWVKIQELLEKNKEKRYRADCKHDFLFSGILRCSECGSYMRPKIAQGERFYYICELKEKSRGMRCHSKNINGKALDELMMKKLEKIFVPTSEVYQELSKLTIKKDRIELDTKVVELNKKIKTNDEAMKNLIDKLKYMDIEVIDLINSELKRLKQENKELEDELIKLKTNKETEENFRDEESKMAELILDIINNCFKTFNYLDIKSKKDILRILIEDMQGSGQNVEVDILNTKISQNDKRLFSDMFEETANKKDKNVVSRLGLQFL